MLNSHIINRGMNFDSDGMISILCERSYEIYIIRFRIILGIKIIAFIGRRGLCQRQNSNYRDQFIVCI